MPSATPIRYEASPKRVRVMFNDKTVADSIDAGLLLESGHPPVYYFPRGDVRMDLLRRTEHRSHCPYKGDASYWTLEIGNRIAANAVWSYETPLAGLANIERRLAFYWNRVDRWLEEDEEVFGHPRDPYHRVDVRASAREVSVTVAGEGIATTRRALFVFETGLPTRYYIPPEDVRAGALVPSSRRTVCPYKGQAAYWSLRLGDRVVEDAAWSYPNPLPECARIGAYFCFDPQKAERIDVEI